MPDPIVARCTHCNASFTEAQIAGHFACPSCGSKGLPCDPSKDVTITINTHELRILGIWAENYGRDVDQNNLDTPGHESLRETVQIICGRIEEQLKALGKWTPLTLSGEMKQLKEVYGGENVTMFRNGLEELD